MKIEIRETKENGLLQITTLDERFYMRKSDSKIFGSSTWISGYTPAKELFEWAKRMGEDADRIRDERGDVGNKIHQAIDTIVARKVQEGTGYIDVENEVFQNTKGEFSPLTAEECEAVLSWVNWWKELNENYSVKIIAFEQADYNEEFMYAGTKDLRLELTAKREVKEDLSGTWTIDYKSSKSIYLSHIVQISSYKHFPGCENDRLGILQVGYNLNKRKYKFTEVQDRFDLFLAAYKFWAEDNADKQPKQFQIPSLLKI